MDLASKNEVTGNPKPLSLLRKRRLTSLDEILLSALVVESKQAFV
jgi:hypothetical protein